jgi:hypothetical protein
MLALVLLMWSQCLGTLLHIVEAIHSLLVTVLLEPGVCATISWWCASVHPIGVQR